MTNVLRLRFLPLLMLGCLPNQALSNNCTAMEASAPAWFATQLDQAEATHQQGNSADAFEQLRLATTEIPRRVDVSLDARCVGSGLWQRYYLLRRSVSQAQGQAAEKAGKMTGTRGALDWYVAGDNQADARRVIPSLTPSVEGTSWVISRLRSEVQRLDQAAESGFELLPEERAALAFWQRGLDGTVRYARSKVTEVLAAETGLLTRPPTEAELRAEQAQQGKYAMAANFFGDESLAPDLEALRESNRAKASLTLLESAQDWGMAVSEKDAAPVNERAVQRGDALLARANDTSLGLESRESLLEAAEDYFDFADNRERREAARRALAAIAPALEAERARRNAKIDQRADEWRDSAAEMQKAVLKTEEQKKSFRDEAESLEDELGF